jgi:hypothetical protein
MSNPLDIARRMRRESRSRRNDERAIASREFVNAPLPMAPSQRATLQHGTDFEGGVLAYGRASDGPLDFLALSHSSHAADGRLGAASLQALDSLALSPSLRAADGRLSAASLQAPDFLALSHSSRAADGRLGAASLQALDSLALSPPSRAVDGRLGAASLQADVDVTVEPVSSLSSPLKHAIALFSEQDGIGDEAQAEALTRIIDDQVEAAVATSPVVVSLSQAADAQRTAIQLLHEVRLSLSFSQSPPDQDGHSLAQVQGGSAPTRGQAAEVQGGSTATPAPSSDSDVRDPSDGTRSSSLVFPTAAATPGRAPQSPSLQDVNVKLGALETQLSATLAARDVAIREARGQARAQLASELSSHDKRFLVSVLPSGPMDRFLRRSTREQRFASIAAPLSRTATIEHPKHHPFRGPMDNFAVAMPRHHFPATSARQPVSSAPAPFENPRRTRYDREERREIRRGHDIVAELASPESHDNVDDNGYERDGFCVKDKDIVFSDSGRQSTGDDSCTTFSGSLNSDESDDEAERRFDLVSLTYRDLKRKAKPGKFLALSLSGNELQTQRDSDVTVKRPTATTHLVETILSHWVRCNLQALRQDALCGQIAELLKLLRNTPHEYGIAIYYALTKRVRPVSKSLFKLVVRCVEKYLPEQRGVLHAAYADVTADSAPSATAGGSEKPVKPTARAPTIHDITDIKDATGRFFDEYRHYEREYKGWKHKSAFQCLTPSQATTFASQCRMPEAKLEAMPANKLFELWRLQYGFRSSADLLAALKRIPFRGNILTPNNWSSYHERFTKTLNQAPLTKRPPPEAIAIVFVENCRNSFLEDDVLAHEPEDHDVALRLVLDRLNDSGFLQSDGLRESSLQ